MAKDYPNLSISDDWNGRQSDPVTSFADDVKHAENEPTLGLFHDKSTGPFVETSAGAVPADSAQAKAAADVYVKGSDPFAALREQTEGSAGADSSGADDSTPFDPSTHTVDEVNGYLLGDITSAERDRVLAAEREGKNRSSVNGI